MSRLSILLRWSPCGGRMVKIRLLLPEHLTDALAARFGLNGPSLCFRRGALLGTSDGD